MYSEPFRHWLVLAALLASFLLSWQWAYGFGGAGVELQEIQFQTAEPLLTLDNALPGCSRLRMFWLRGGEASATASTQSVELISLTDSIQLNLVLTSFCEREMMVRLPVVLASSFSEQPVLFASSSGRTTFHSLADSDSLLLQLASGSGTTHLWAPLATAGDRVSIDLAYIQEVPVNGHQAGFVSAAFADQSIFEVASDLPSQLWFTNMLQPSLPTHVQPVEGCKTDASLFFPSDQGVPCRFGAGLKGYYPQRQAKGKNLFLQQSDGSFTPLPQPPVSKPTQAGEVVISEVMWSGDDPWLELYNSTKTRFNLRGLSILGAGSNGGSLLVNVDLIVEPYGYVIIGRNRAAASLLLRDPDWVTSLFSLRTSNAEVVVRAQNGGELDRTPTGPWLKGSTASPLSSAQRRSSTLPGNNWENWEVCSSIACDFSQYWKSPTQTRGSPWQPTVL